MLPHYYGIFNVKHSEPPAKSEEDARIEPGTNV